MAQGGSSHRLAAKASKGAGHPRAGLSSGRSSRRAFDHWSGSCAAHYANVLPAAMVCVAKVRPQFLSLRHDCEGS